MAAPSDGRNGVVVNRAIDSTTGIPNCLVEQRCINAKSSSQIRAKSEGVLYRASTLPQYSTGTPKIRISTAFYSTSLLEQFLRSFTALLLVRINDKSQAIDWFDS